MPRYEVQFTGTRLVSETVEGTVEVSAWGLGGVETAVRAAIVAGDFDVEDCYPTEGAIEGPTSFVSFSGVTVVDEPTPTVVQEATTYQPVGRAAPTGFAPADVHTREGYSPARVMHRPV